MEAETTADREKTTAGRQEGREPVQDRLGRAAGHIELEDGDTA